MIPLQVPPLTGLCVWVTRPQLPAQALSEHIEKLGGTALSLPVLDIKPCVSPLPTISHDLLIFVSANAVQHGMAVLQAQFALAATRSAVPQVAAIGKATALALIAAQYPPDIVAAAPFNSEALLAHDALQSPPARILVISGVGGRTLLRDTLTARGSQVEVAAVYERVPAVIANATAEPVMQALRAATIDVITVTSRDLLHALSTTVSAALNTDELARVQRLTILAGSPRIAAELRTHGWSGECVISESPDDTALLTALTRWHTRARN